MTASATATKGELMRVLSDCIFGPAWSSATSAPGELVQGRLAEALGPGLCSASGMVLASGVDTVCCIACPCCFEAWPSFSTSVGAEAGADTAGAGSDAVAVRDPKYSSTERRNKSLQAPNGCHRLEESAYDVYGILAC
jgi:hypothetical protein